uniref:Uncharacterized protein n=1 Tax=Wuchereria bancrofti TaxID=6293 RepID=A0A1I8EWT6_WUCBA
MMKHINRTVVIPKIRSFNTSLIRNNVIAKRIDGKLLIAPCKSNSLNSKIIEIKGGLISKFEIDKVNAVLEILAQNQRMINPNFKPRETTKFWDELSQQGEELS